MRVRAAAAVPLRKLEALINALYRAWVRRPVSHARTEGVKSTAGCLHRTMTTLQRRENHSTATTGTISYSFLSARRSWILKRVHENQRGDAREARTPVRYKATTSTDRVYLKGKNLVSKKPRGSMEEEAPPNEAVTDQGSPTLE